MKTHTTSQLLLGFGLSCIVLASVSATAQTRARNTKSIGVSDLLTERPRLVSHVLYCLSRSKRQRRESGGAGLEGEGP
jgi:hypothetical protein